MIPHLAQQGSGEWLAARSKILTASNFGKVLTPAKLEHSEQSGGLALVIAAARVYDVYEDTVSTYDTERGLELEDEAREAYAFLSGSKVKQVGLCMTDDELFGASPDGLIGEDGGLEIKCPSLAVHLSYLIGGCVPAKYRLQVQGALWVTGRAWWDFFSYYPGLPPLLVRVEPDPVVFAAFDEALPKFEHSVRVAVKALESLK